MPVRRKFNPPGTCGQCSLFFDSQNFCATLTKSELGNLSNVSSMATLKRGETLASDALARWPIVAVASGVMSVQHVLEDGRRTIAAFFMRGDIIDMRSDAGRNRGSLVALRKTECCRLSPVMFDKIVTANPDAHNIVWRILRDQTFRSIEHSADLAKKRALEKLASFIFECRNRQIGELPGGAVDTLIRRCDLAEYLGMQPETVSRCFRELEENLIIRIAGRSQVIVQNVPALRRIANGHGGEMRPEKPGPPDLKILRFA